MGHREKVLVFLNKIAPKSASNAEIASHTRIKPHAQVYLLTQLLMDQRAIEGCQAGQEWVFSADNGQSRRAADISQSAEAPKPAPAAAPIRPVAFEALCQDVLPMEFGTELRPALVEDIPKRFDLVSEDERIIGDAKYYTAVNGISLPPAKFATIAEYVWLLEKTKAEKKFLVFGNDRCVPEWWLDRYGGLTSVTFYYLAGDRVLEKLH